MQKKILLCTISLCFVCASLSDASDNAITQEQAAPQTENKKTSIWNKPKTTQNNSADKTQTAPDSARSNQNNSKPNVSGYVLEYAGFIYDSCKGSWQEKTCVQALSALSRDITVDYNSKLVDAQKQNFQEPLKQNCAATTAALKQDVPAYAQKSAMTVCLNAIADIFQASGVKPDLNLYQMAVQTIPCQEKTGNCEAFESPISKILNR